jgi:threonine/homoserine/homoserine lactone efflux protein
MPKFISYVVILLVSTLTPGPNNILSMSRAAQVGFRNSFRLNLGMYAGFLAVIGLVTAFNFYLTSALPAIKPVLQIIGTVYILWLAFTIVWGQKKGKASAPTATGNFLTGFSDAIHNPKVIIFSLTITSTFITPYYSSPLALRSGFVLLNATMGLHRDLQLGLFGSLFNQLFVKQARTRNIILAFFLAGSALSLYLLECALVAAPTVQNDRSPRPGPGPGPGCSAW